MAGKQFGLGRGLNSLIPQRTPPTPSTSSATPIATQTIDALAPGEQRVVQVAVADIAPNPDQPRLTFSHHELEELMNSIREHGVLVPLIVSKKTSGGYELIAGERRLRAAIMLGLKAVPAMVRTADAHQRLVWALIENIQRQDLSSIEEAKAYQRLLTEFNLTQEEVAQRVGKARSTVANLVRLLDLPPQIQEAIASGTISTGSARAILGLQDDKSRLRFFKKLLGGSYSTRQVEEDVRTESGGVNQRRDIAVSATEDELREKFGARITITKKVGKGVIAFYFYSDEEYAKLSGKLRA